jgi:hypothetical protein
MEIRAIWRRKPRSTSSHRLALAATELPDRAVARLGRGTRQSDIEAEQMRGLLRAGGAAVAHR